MITNKQVEVIKRAVKSLRGHSQFITARELENEFGLVWIECKNTEPPKKGVYSVTYKGGKTGFELYKGDGWISIDEVIKWKRISNAYRTYN